MRISAIRLLSNDSTNEPGFWADLLHQPLVHYGGYLQPTSGDLERDAFMRIEETRRFLPRFESQLPEAPVSL